MAKTSRRKSVESSTKSSVPKSPSNVRRKLAVSASGSKSVRITALLSRPGGATISGLMKMTGWQAHSIRGFMSGALKKRKGLLVSGHKDETGVMRYRIGEGLQ